MAKIKVTGFIYTSELDHDQVDLDHSTGLTDKGFLYVSDQLAMLDDLDCVLQ